MDVKLRALRDDLQRSLFFVPMLFVLGAVAVAELTLLVDERVEHLPSRLTATSTALAEC